MANSRIDIERLYAILKNCGPLRGKELCELTSLDRLNVWRTCKTDDNITTISIARHYLRLDKQLKDFARLSPSIWREFYSYTIIGLDSNREIAIDRASELRNKITEISRSKLRLAKYICENIFEHISYNYSDTNDKVFFLIAGDVVFDMAHDDPRPELSTGKLVVGSDIDLVVIVDDSIPQNVVKLIDDLIYQEKTRLVMSPYNKEELDYVVKTKSALEEQMAMKTFKQMVAMKVFCEGKFLAGSRDFYHSIKGDFRIKKITSMFQDLEERARIERALVEKELGSGVPLDERPEYEVIFYPAEESEEF